MKKVPLVAAINDLSGFGRCSLTVALPIFSAMGIQGCPLPTAILSNHTGYNSCYFEDFTDRMGAYISEWKKLGLSFDGICTGFLGDAAQVEILAQFIRSSAQPDAVLLVDPAMADDGELYRTCTDELCRQMRNLVALGNLVTPNLTEACLLTDESYEDILSADQDELDNKIFSMARRIAKTGPEQVVITGIHSGDRIVNFVYDNGNEYKASSPMVDCKYAGTGDVFAAVLLGYRIHGVELSQAVQKAADFVSEATAHSVALGVRSTDGIAFEPFLSRLAQDIDRLGR